MSNNIRTHKFNSISIGKERKARTTFKLKNMLSIVVFFSVSSSFKALPKKQQKSKNLQIVRKKRSIKLSNENESL